MNPARFELMKVSRRSFIFNGIHPGVCEDSMTDGIVCCLGTKSLCDYA